MNTTPRDLEPAELEEEWQLVPESECDDQDDYPSDDQIRANIAGWVEEQAAIEYLANTQSASATRSGEDTVEGMLLP